LIPEGWKVKKANDVISTQYGYTESACDEVVGPNYLRGTDINKQSYIDWSSVPFCPIDEKAYKKYKLYKNDVVIIRMADPGKIGIIETDVDAVFASYLIRLSVIDSQLTPYYLFYMANDSIFQGFVLGASTGATRKSISAETIKEAKIIIPGKTIQERFDEVVKPYRRLLNYLIIKNANLRKTRDSLLPALINGDIDISNLDIKNREE
jgi:type I restriction enzyme S subunit